MASKGMVFPESECHEKINSPPPKPPRRRHSEQLSKLCGTGTAIRRKNLSNNSFLSSSGATAVNGDITYECESLPADWVPVCPENQAKVAAENTDNQHYLDEDSFSCDTLLSEVGLTSLPPNSCKNSCEEGNTFPVASTSMWPCHNRKCISIAGRSDQNSPEPAAVQNLLANDKSLLSYGLKCDFPQNHDTKSLLHRHHSYPLLTKHTRPFFCSSSYSSNDILEGASFDPVQKGFHCPHVFKDVCFLSEEVKSLKERNDKLWQHMCLLQKRLDDSSGALKNSDASSSFSELMYDIYKTQKDRDTAVEKRLKAAMEERDAAVQELEEVLRSITKLPSDDEFSEDEIEKQELKQLFKEIETTKNPVKLLHQQRILLSCLCHSKEMKLNHITHQLKMALEEKKQAVEKAEKLEEELMKWKSSRCLLHSEAKQWEAGLVEALCQAISQRDSALARVQCFREQIQTLKLQLNSYQLKNYLSDELYNADSEQMSKSETVSSGGFDPGMAAQSNCKETKDPMHTDTDADQLKFLRYRVTYLTHQLDCEIKHRLAAEENCQKLEKAVSLLHRKLNGINVGVSV